jgi:hypothetical protein
VKTFFELTPRQRDQVAVQWSNWQPYDFYYTEGRDGLLISRTRIPAESLRTFVALHPAFGYQLYSSQHKLVGVVRFDGEVWTVNGAAMDYSDARGLVERWYRDGKEVLLWQCLCSDCWTSEVKRLGLYVDARITHGLCPVGGAKLILETKREMAQMVAEVA